MKLKQLMEKNILKKINQNKNKIGPSESMSKSKKNTIDPENIISKLWSRCC